VGFDLALMGPTSGFAENSRSVIAPIHFTQREKNSLACPTIVFAEKCNDAYT
jgi:hypothetical protein